VRTHTHHFHIIYQKEVTSTNLVVRRLAEKNEPEGTLVVAEIQTSGKGRKGKSWFSFPGKSLTFSFLLRPVKKLSVAQTLETLGFYPSLKWPNDIYLNQKKVAGILIENSIQFNRLRWTIAGVGVNLNLKREDFPARLQKSATSLLIEGGKPIHPKEFLQIFSEIFRVWYSPWEKNQCQAQMMKEYIKRSATLGKMVRWKKGGKTHQGRAEAIDENGGLWVACEEGQRRLSWGEVSIAPVFLDEYQTNEPWDLGTGDSS